MARKATEIEERLAVGEKVLTEEFLGTSLPQVHVKVVYLGGNPHKFVRIKGQITILREERLSIADLVVLLYPDRKNKDGSQAKWVDLLPEEQEHVRNELVDRHKDVLATDEVVKQEGEHYTGYDFSTVDALGRKLPFKTEPARSKYQMTEDGHRYQMVEHLGHVVALNRMIDSEGAKQFEIRGTPREIEVIREYIKLTTRQVNADSGAAVLKDMGLTDDGAEGAP
jgi:hypothetical protein